MLVLQKCKFSSDLKKYKSYRSNYYNKLLKAIIYNKNLKIMVYDCVIMEKSLFMT